MGKGGIYGAFTVPRMVTFPIFFVADFDDAWNPSSYSKEHFSSDQLSSLPW